jgi:hypothetical protein
LFGDNNENDFTSRDQRISLVHKLKNKIKLEKIKKLELQSKELKNDRVTNFGKFLVYLAYIFFFTVTVTRHLRVVDKYKVTTAIQSSLMNAKYTSPKHKDPFNFYEIQTISDYTAWLKSFVASYKKLDERNRLKTLARYNFHISPLVGNFFF